MFCRHRHIGLPNPARMRTAPKELNINVMSHWKIPGNPSPKPQSHPAMCTVWTTYHALSTQNGKEPEPNKLYDNICKGPHPLCKPMRTNEQEVGATRTCPTQSSVHPDSGCHILGSMCASTTETADTRINKLPPAWERLPRDETSLHCPRPRALHTKTSLS
jgi:hypothetical protein